VRIITSVLVAFLALPTASFAQSQPPAANSISVSDVSFPSGSDDVPAILARPAGQGRFPAVILIHANSLREPYIAEAASRLARAGFVALAVDVFHFLPRLGWEEYRRYSRDSVNARLAAGFKETRLVRDITSSIGYLRTLSFVRPGGVGLVGFCGGGWNAFLVAAQTQDVAAVVAFYAPVALGDSTRRSAQTVSRYLTVPVQYHRALDDPAVPAADVEHFTATLRGQGTPIDTFTYEARHGFVATNRDGIFDAGAAEQAWARAVPFLREHLGRTVRIRPLAPPWQPGRALDRGESNAAGHWLLHR
jgi:carboxymethylenebutenolidase